MEERKLTSNVVPFKKVEEQLTDKEELRKLLDSIDEKDRVVVLVSDRSGTLHCFSNAISNPFELVGMLQTAVAAAVEVMSEKGVPIDG